MKSRDIPGRFMGIRSRHYTGFAVTPGPLEGWHRYGLPELVSGQTQARCPAEALP
jgi:hypothetical protein